LPTRTLSRRIARARARSEGLRLLILLPGLSVLNHCAENPELLERATEREYNMEKKSDIDVSRLNLYAADDRPLTDKQAHAN
jgi:hypothetical protein